MPNNQGLRGTIPHLGDTDAELFWHLASYVGGLIIEWSRLERAIDLIVFHGVQRRIRGGVKEKIPGDFTSKLELVPIILEENENTRQGTRWLKDQIPRILEIKETRDTLVHGYFGSVGVDPVAISFNRRRYRKSGEKWNTLSITEADFQDIIKYLRNLDGKLAMFVLASAI